MKKFYFLLSAFLLSMAMTMVSCGSDKKGSGKDDDEKTEKVSKEEKYVRKLEKLADDFVEACESGNANKAMTISKKIEALADKADAETNDEDYTEEQKDRMQMAIGKIAIALGTLEYDDTDFDF